MKVIGINMVGLSSYEDFSVECDSYRPTGKTFQGTPIYELISANLSTLKGNIDGVLIDVKEEP